MVNFIFKRLIIKIKINGKLVSTTTTDTTTTTLTPAETSINDYMSCTDGKLPRRRNGRSGTGQSGVNNRNSNNNKYNNKHST